MHVNVMGGLCNRLMAINSARRLARETGRKLVIHWRIDGAMNCRYRDLFEPADFRVVEMSRRSWLSRRLHTLLFKSNPFCIHENDERRFIDRCRDSRMTPLYCSTYNDFYAGDDYGWVTPVAAIRDAVEQVAAMADGNIGVHIRRSDHAECIRNSPTELFLKAMREDLERNPDTRFFVASDSDDEKRNLREEFGERVLTREGVRARGDVGGVADAVVDLMLLSQCRKIYGSYPSTFSMVAAAIGRTELRQMRV